MPSSQAVNTVYCQSCGMPMGAPEQFGTEADGGRSSEYCTYCYRNGAFTLDVDKDTFMAMQVKIAVEKLGVDEAKAREMATTILPTLKRWKT